jgi:hypothetical protein
MNDRCRGFLGMIRCNFQPRYADHLTGSPEWIGDILEASKLRVYVCDVCTACGEQRMRPPQREGKE